MPLYYGVDRVTANSINSFIDNELTDVLEQFLESWNQVEYGFLMNDNLVFLIRDKYSVNIYKEIKYNASDILHKEDPTETFRELLQAEKDEQNRKLVEEQNKKIEAHQKSEKILLKKLIEKHGIPDEY